MTLKTLVAATAVGAALAVSAGSAAAATFVFDPSNSSIDLDRTLDWCAGCGLSYDFLPVDPWTASAAGDTHRVDDFVEWTIGPGLGMELYDVTATLAFSSPSTASASTGGVAGVASLFGVINGGVLMWDDAGSIAFDDGTVLEFRMDDAAVAGFSSSYTTGVSFTASSVSAVPLPATGWLLLAGLGALAIAGRRRRVATA